MASSLSSAMEARGDLSSTTHDQHSQSAPTVSSHPYRAHREPTSDEAMIALAYVVERNPTISRDKIPARAVFTDLYAAPPPITSGSVRSKVQTLSNVECDAFEEEDSIPLQDLQPTETGQPGLLSKLPLPPSPAFLSSSRFDDDTSNYLHPKHIAAAFGEQPTDLDIPTEPPVQEELPSMLTSMKHAFRMGALHLMESGLQQSEIKPHWPEDHATRLECYNIVGQNASLSIAAGRPPGTRRGRAMYLQRRSSIYHSTLGAAPSGSVRASSSDADGDYQNASGGTSGISSRAFGGVDSDAYQNASTPAIVRQLQNSSESSVHDASTIGNIYRHYVESDVAQAHNEDDSDSGLSIQKAANESRFNKQDDGQASSSGSQASDGSHESPWVYEKHTRVGKFSLDPHGGPPNLALPELPLRRQINPVFASSVPDGAIQSPSYGQTRDILNLAKPNATGGVSALSRSACHADLHLGTDGSRGPQLQSTNPFRRSQGPQNVTAGSQDTHGYGDGMHQAPVMKGREPLEREVSKALRRASGFSAYSDGSISSSVLCEPYGKCKDVPSGAGDIGLAKQYNDEATHPASCSEGEKGLTARGRGFYEQAAIAPDWISVRHQNVVRVPIAPVELIPDCPPTSLQHGREGSSESRPYQPYAEDDVGDWETVGESVFGVELNGSRDHRMFGGSINQTGSSIANWSDDETNSSNIPEFNSFGSTERIAHHPGTINFFGDYRQRDLKKTKTPLFVPIFREHRVNGYLADSNRTKPRPALFTSLKPQPALARSHANPFKSPPPVINSTGPVRNLYTAGGREPATNCVPFPLKDLSLSTEFDGELRGVQFSQPSVSASASKRRSATLNWLTDFRDTGSTINATTPKHFRLNIPIRYHSSQNAMESVVIAAKQDFNDAAHGVSSASEVQGKIIYGDSPEALKDNRRTSLMEAKYQKTLAQGPPGALYQGIRARPESRDINGSAERKLSVKSPGRNKTAKDHPTNSLRPLSLVATHLQSSSVRAEEADRIVQSRPYGFSYRSPLAPVVSEDWKALYTPTQLAAMEEQARQHLGSRAQPTGGYYSAEDPWRVHLYEAPRLFPSPRQAERRPGAAQRKDKISTVTFWLCNLFPPFLVLLATGHLDQLMAALSSNEFTAFSDKQKKWARIATVLWLLLIVVGFALLIALEFTHRQLIDQ